MSIVRRISDMKGFKKIKSNRDSFHLLNMTTRTLGMNYVTFIFAEIKINFYRLIV